MTKEEEYRQILGPYVSPRYGNGFLGTSFLDAYRNADDRLGRWNNVVDSENFKKEEILGFKDSLRSQKLDAAIGGGVAALNGITTLGAGMMQAAHTADMTPYNNMLQDYSRIGSYNYNNYDQLANDYAELQGIDIPSYTDVRGMTNGQKWGSIGTAALSGASTGTQIGGPLGGLIGLAVGAGLQGAAVLSGDNVADMKLNAFKSQASIAQDNAAANLGAAHERIGANNHRQQIGNVVANGGSISIKEYADRVLSNRSRQRRNTASAVTRTKTEDGVKYRIRVK